MTCELSNWLFTTDNVLFLNSRCAKIIFHGIKNDISRSGFEVQMQPTDDPKLNPVHALQVYIDRTEKFRSAEKPVFLSLVPPYGPISASSVASILNEAIKMAGLSNQGFLQKASGLQVPLLLLNLAVTQKLLCDRDAGKHDLCFLITMFMQNLQFPCLQIFFCTTKCLTLNV